MQRAAFRAIALGAAFRPFISQKHYAVSQENIPYFLAYIKNSGNKGINFKYISNEAKSALVFEGLATMNAGHAQHNQLADEVWGESGYRYFDVQGGYVHARYEAADGTIRLMFYGSSDTYNVNRGGGDIDDDLFRDNDDGQWFAANAANRFRRIAAQVADITDNPGQSSTEHRDIETGKVFPAHEVILRPNASLFI